MNTACAIQFVMVGPVNWLQQDPDPPPSFRLSLLEGSWSVLALGLHYLLTPRRTVSDFA